MQTVTLQKLIAAHNALAFAHAQLLPSTDITDDECNEIEEARIGLERVIQAAQTQLLEVTP